MQHFSAIGIESNDIFCMTPIVLSKEPLTLEDYCDLVLAFLKFVGEQTATLIGHSHGGRVIMKAVGEGLLKPKKIVFLDAAGLIPKKCLKQ